MKKGESFLPYAAVLLAMFSIQFGASLAKSLFVVLGPLGLTSLRTGFAAILLFILWRPWRRKVARREASRILIFGFSLGAMNLFFYLALARIPLGLAVALEFTGPLGYAIFCSRRNQDFLWAGLAALGIYEIIPQGAGPAANFGGVVFALIAGFFWALYIFFGQRVGKEVPSGIVTAWGMLAAALLTSPFLGGSHLTWSILPMAFLVALLCSAIPYSLEMIALKKIPGKTFGILMSVEPAIAALSGWLFLHEVLSVHQWLALGCIIIASLGSSLSSGVKTQDPP